jgi:hypothetical protein
VFHAAAEDAMITPGVDVRGVLDTSFTRVPAEAPDKFSRLDGLALAADNLRAAAAAL